jgi:hypothetical protein
MEIFEDYIPGFMQVFLDDFNVFGARKAHLQHVELCLKKCREARLSLIQRSVPLQSPVGCCSATS